MPVSIVIVNFLLLASPAVAQAQNALSSFEKLENPEAGTDGFLALETPLMSRKVSNKIDCARLCNDRNGSDCTALEFDEHSGNCTVGVGVTTVKGVKNGQTQNVFYTNTRIADDGPDDQTSKSVDEGLDDKTACEINPGFAYILHSSGESACLHVSDQKVPGNFATQLCESKAPGGRLYIMKTSARFDIFAANRKKSLEIVWVGLRKKESSDSFFWDDGEELVRNSEMWNILWNEGQPDISDYQLCVGSKSGDEIKLNDFDCKDWGRYACEIPFPLPIG